VGRAFFFPPQKPTFLVVHPSSEFDVGCVFKHNPDGNMFT